MTTIMGFSLGIDDDFEGPVMHLTLDRRVEGSPVDKAFGIEYGVAGFMGLGFWQHERLIVRCQ